MSTHNFIIIILNTLMFSMLFHLCKFATACHSLKNVDENQPIKKKTSVCWAKQITTEVWYLCLHLEFKSQLRLQAAKETLHKVSFTTTNEWYKLKLNFKKTT